MALIRSRLAATAAAFLLTTTATTGIATAQTATTELEPVTVSVTAIVEHPSLDALRDGVHDALREAGYVDGETLEFVYESAQGNQATAAQIARTFVGLQPDVIVPISTPSAQAVTFATADIPVVFGAVTDPLGAELVTNLEAPGANVTGVSDFLPIADHLALIKEVMPEAATIGVVYNPGEANSVVLLEAVTAQALDYDLTVEEAAAPRASDVQAAAQSLVGRADVFYVTTDNTVVSALESVIVVAEANGIPLFTGDTDSVRRGSLASLGFDYYQVGLQTGDLVLQILSGEAPGAIPVHFATGTDLVLNLGAAERMGVTVPQSVIDRATEVVE